jgi:hypothetical protein
MRAGMTIGGIVLFGLAAGGYGYYMNTQAIQYNQQCGSIVGTLGQFISSDIRQGCSNVPAYASTSIFLMIVGGLSRFTQYLLYTAIK